MLPDTEEERIPNEVQEEVQEQVEQNVEAPDTPTEEPAKPAEPAEEYDEIVYNKQLVRVPKSQRKELLQKGYNYDKVRSQRDQLEAALKHAAQLAGYEDTDSYLYALEQDRIRAAAESKGVPVEVYTKLQQMEIEIKQSQTERLLNQQREALLNKPHFKEHEAEIVAIGKQIGDLDAAYAYYLKENYTKLTEEIRKQAVEDFKRQASKGGVQGSDDAPAVAGDIPLTKAERAHAERQVARGYFKDVQEWARWHKSNG